MSEDLNCVEQSEEPTTTQIERPFSAEEAINEQIKRTFSGVPLNQNTSAPVIIGNEEDMVMRVIPETVIKQFIFASEDEDIVNGLLWAFVGGLIAIIVNLVMSWHVPQITECILCGFFVVGIIIFGILKHRFSNRKTEMVKSDLGKKEG